MKAHLISFRAAIFAALFLPVSVTTMRAADLTVTVKEIHNDTGTIFIAVYDAKENFMKPARARAKQKAKAKSGELTFVIHDLPAGQYAVAAFQDENGNGKLDRNWLGVPTEGYGFSNDAEGASGPPRFAQAAFAFDGENSKTIAFSLNY